MEVLMTMKKSNKNKILRSGAVLACLVLLGAATGCSESNNDEAGAVSLMGVGAFSDASVSSQETDQVVVYIQGEVTKVKDKNDELGGAIGAGDPISGKFCYDQSQEDADPLVDVGQYDFNAPPTAIELTCQELTFSSDPQAPDIAILITNQASDSYDVSSSSNLDVLPGVEITDIEIQLVDNDGNALVGDWLFGLEYDIDDWPSVQRIRIKSGSNLKIDVRITSISRMPSTEHDGRGVTKYRYHEEPH